MSDPLEHAEEAAKEPDTRGAEDGDPAPPPSGPETEQPEEPETSESEEPEEPSETPPESEPEPQGLSEKEIERRIEKLDKEGVRHRNRLAEILDEDVLQLVPCELCEPGMDGFRYAHVPEDRRSAVMTAMGFAPAPELAKDPDAEQCPVCKGEGQVATGSKVQGYAAMVCRRCKGFGAVGARFQDAPSYQVPPESAVAVNGPPPETVPTDEDAAEIARLRAKGFTVMAPPSPVQA